MIAPERLAYAPGFGLAMGADGYRYRPTDVEGVREAFADARRADKKVVLRGAGRSYGDASFLPEGVILDTTRMRQILRWDAANGILEAEGGVTIGDVWRATLEDGWWPPVVSGTMFPTLAGALAMNIHGKNNQHAGTLGEHVRAIDVVRPDGELLTLKSSDPAFRAVISGAGLLGAITRVELEMKRVTSGNLRVLPIACRNWDEQFEIFERLEGDADYHVSWIDCFAKGRSFGRGQFHGAWYLDDDPASLAPEVQELPDTILGLFPKSIVWRFLKMLNHPMGMQTVNGLKQFASQRLGDGKPMVQSLVAFSFLLDYVPHWRRAYEPGGFIQYQSFVPRSRAPEVFARQVEMQHEAGIVSFLGVLKRHRPDHFLLSHGVNGYSLALDFKVTPGNRSRLWDLCHRMNDLVTSAGGRFYLAKDATLRRDDLRKSLGDATLDEFAHWRNAFDPQRTLSSGLAERLGL